MCVRQDKQAVYKINYPLLPVVFLAHIITSMKNYILWNKAHDYLILFTCRFLLLHFLVYYLSYLLSIYLSHYFSV